MNQRRPAFVLALICLCTLFYSPLAAATEDLDDTSLTHRLESTLGQFDDLVDWMEPRLLRVSMASSPLQQDFETAIDEARQAIEESRLEAAVERLDDADQIYRSLFEESALVEAIEQPIDDEYHRQMRDISVLLDYPKNIFFAASFSGVGNQFYRRHQGVLRCIRPPRDLRATYTIGIVDFDGRSMASAGVNDNRLFNHDIEPRLDVFSDQFIDGKDREEQMRKMEALVATGHQFAFVPDKLQDFVADSMTNHFPSRDYAQKPQVRMVFNLADHRWALALGDHWPDKERYKHHVDGLLATSSLAVTDDSVVGDVCSVVDDLEALLAVTERERLDLAVDLASTSALFDITVDRLEQWAPSWLETTTVIGQDVALAVDDFDAAYDRAQQAFDDHQYKRARTELSDAASHYTTVADALQLFAKGHRTATELRKRLDDLEDTLAFRDKLFMPDRIQAWEFFDRADTSLTTLEDSLGSDISLPALRVAEQEAIEAVDLLAYFLNEIKESHNETLIIASLGLAVFVIFLGGGGLYLFRRRLDRPLQQELELQAHIDQWESRFYELHDRAQKIRTTVQALDDNTLPHDLLETIDLLIALDAALHELNDELHHTFDRPLSAEAKAQAIDELLESETLTIDGQSSSRLRGSHEFERANLLDEFEELLDQVQSSLSAY